MISTWREYHTTIVVVVVSAFLFIGGLVAVVSWSSGPSDPDPDCTGRHGGVVGVPVHDNSTSTFYYTCKDGRIVARP